MCGVLLILHTTIVVKKVVFICYFKLEYKAVVGIDKSSVVIAYQIDDPVCMLSL